MLTDAIDAARLAAGGDVALAKRLADMEGRPLTYQAILKWRTTGMLPRTEWTGESHYARAFEEITGGKVHADELLAVLQDELLKKRAGRHYRAHGGRKAKRQAGAHV